MFQHVAHEDDIEMLSSIAQLLKVRKRVTCQHLVQPFGSRLGHADIELYASNPDRGVLPFQVRSDCTLRAANIEYPAKLARDQANQVFATAEIGAVQATFIGQVDSQA
jgi:hypothetical protein